MQLHSVVYNLSMDQPINRPVLGAPDSYGAFWMYLSQNQRDLILEGNYLMNDVIKHQNYEFKDYSFLIFPYAKAYEGYLKQLFYDIKFMNHLDYISDHFRLGKMMSPHLVDHLGDRSLYRQIKDHATKELADQVWDTWKLGRNQIFHYFPHNVRGVTFEEAQQIINTILLTMKEVYAHLKKEKTV